MTGPASRRDPEPDPSAEGTAPLHPAPGIDGTDATGLPGVRSWRGVYAFVVCVFLLWVGLLTWFMRTFS